MRLVPESSSLGRWLVLAPLALTAGALLAARLAPGSLLTLAHCPLRDLTGLPCPTCGGTHALLALANGDLAAAWRINPAVPAGAGIVAVWALWAAAAAGAPGLRVRPELSPREAKAAAWVAAAAVVGLWLRQVVALP